MLKGSAEREATYTLFTVRCVLPLYILFRFRSTSYIRILVRYMRSSATYIHTYIHKSYLSCSPTRTISFSTQQTLDYLPSFSNLYLSSFPGILLPPYSKHLPLPSYWCSTCVYVCIENSVPVWLLSDH